jgi:hypothetical protein
VCIYTTDVDVRKDVEDTPIDLRDYQMELAQKGREGKNVIIVSPTNTGKTRVACKIIQVIILLILSIEIKLMRYTFFQMTHSKKKNNLRRIYLSDKEDLLIKLFKLIFIIVLLYFNAERNLLPIEVCIRRNHAKYLF